MGRVGRVVRMVERVWEPRAAVYLSTEVHASSSAQIGWMSEAGERLDLSVEGDGEAECPRTGRRYQLKAGKIC